MFEKYLNCRFILTGSTVFIYLNKFSSLFWKNTNVKHSVYVNTILRFFLDDFIDIFMGYPCLKIMSLLNQ